MASNKKRLHITTRDGQYRWAHVVGDNQTGGGDQGYSRRIDAVRGFENLANLPIGSVSSAPHHLVEACTVHGTRRRPVTCDVYELPILEGRATVRPAATAGAAMKAAAAPVAS